MSSGNGRDPPAGDGDRRPRPIAPAQDQAGDAAGLSRQLQAAGRRQVEFVDLGHNGRQRRAAQPFRHRLQPLGRPAGRQQDKNGRIEPELPQARPIEIERPLAPQHRPAGGGQPPRERGAKAGRRPVAVPPADLMQAAQGQAAAQGPVEGRQAQGQQLPGAAAGPFQSAQAIT